MPNQNFLKFIDLVKGVEVDRESLPNLVLAIGNFDGVHLGHKALIKKSLDVSKEKKALGENAESGVFFFSVSPADILSSSPPPHICSFEEKIKLFGLLGVKYAVVGDFSRIRNMEFNAFIDFLKGECFCRAIVCGFNFRFGKGGAGKAAHLSEAFGEEAYIIGAVTSEDGVPISSSRIRKMLLEGNVEGAERLLGNPFFLSGRVLHGKALGRKLGLPTINQDFHEGALIPKKGIYITVAQIDGKCYAGVTNIGIRPTVEEKGRINCETHLLDFDGDLYGKEIVIEFRKRLRDEKKFPSEEELRRAIENDVLAARMYFEKNN